MDNQLRGDEVSCAAFKVLMPASNSNYWDSKRFFYVFSVCARVLLFDGSIHALIFTYAKFPAFNVWPPLKFFIKITLAGSQENKSVIALRKT